MVNPYHPKLLRFGDKHRDFLKLGVHLRDEGDFVVTEPISRLDRQKLVRAACAWARRNNKVVKTEVLWVFPDGPDKPGGKGLKITLTRNYRYRI